MNEDLNKHLEHEEDKEIEANWIAWRKAKLMLELINDKEVFAEALENIKMQNVDYVGFLWLSLKSNDAKDFMNYAHEMFIEHCHSWAQIAAELEADSREIFEMKRDLYGSHKEALDDIYSAIRIERAV